MKNTKHLDKWLKLREKSKDEGGHRLCYCGHTFKCECANPDLETFEESIRRGVLDPNSKTNGWNTNLT